MTAESDTPGDLRLVEELGMLMGRCRRAIGVHAQRALEVHGEGTLRWGVLMCIIRGGATTQREIAEQIAQDPATVSRVLDELEGERLVRRHRDPEDRRKVRVDATAAARKRYERIQLDVVSAVDKALGGLSRGDRLQLRALLHKVLEGHALAECAEKAPTKSRRDE